MGLKTPTAEQTTTIAAQTGLKTPTAEQTTTIAAQTGLKTPMAEQTTTTADQGHDSIGRGLRKALQGSDWNNLSGHVETDRKLRDHLRGRFRTDRKFIAYEAGFMDRGKLWSGLMD
ncbi:hypothetical protein DPX16_8953 [Anabarilius grahami]|uniref:Uncharacterized protein n=1 Tax=Anabarilius grahami TaxID=495550 RepID=A0A3N0ZAI6_ANAGA|nr:hypothetical protein DPX16_8953 [Anabarilius grahami]